MDDRKRETLKFNFLFLWKANGKYLRRRVFKPYVRGIFMRLILFYQRHLSRHTCMYRPTCSQYTLECINNHGVAIGIFLGGLRILRCTPFVKPGKYDPAPENPFKKKWLL
ncbi:MAG: membrane protein insertion efficiency factor YidD [Clostridia bacterium]|nr:membrane protein insertion efficiency factor YidD [Clostridia bacterium]